MTGTRANRAGLFELPENPELEDLFRHALRDLALQIKCHTVGTVQEYDAAQQTVTVRVDVLQVVRDLSREPSQQDPAPVSTLDAVTLQGVPVAWPRAGSSYLTFPLQAGDTGELHVQDRSLAEWTRLKDAAAPLSAFAHILSDSVFHPGLSHTPITPATDAVAAVLEGPAIKVGRGAVAAAARQGDATSAAAGMAAWIAGVNTAIANLGGAPPPPPVDFGTISQGSGKVTIE